MADYFFPILFIRPREGWVDVETQQFRAVHRKWQTSTFDLATLATRHKLSLPYQLIDVYLSSCNLEVTVAADSREEAVDRFGALLLALYMRDLSPTVAPFFSTHSVNDYSGINLRDGGATQAASLPVGMRDGPTSKDITVECWPLYNSLQCKLIGENASLDPSQFEAAVADAEKWQGLEAAQVALRALRDAAIAAPLYAECGQSLLHIWCGLEALFPRVSSEVTFRIGLYLAQLSKSDARVAYNERVRKAYGLRSQVVHGTKRDVTNGEWKDAWGLLMGAGRSVIDRGVLPTETDLLDEVLGDSSS